MLGPALLVGEVWMFSVFFICALNSASLLLASCGFCATEEEAVVVAVLAVMAGAPGFSSCEFGLTESVGLAGGAGDCCLAVPGRLGLPALSGTEVIFR